MRRRNPTTTPDPASGELEPRDLKTVWNEACNRTTKANLGEILAVAKLESERARDSNMDLYFAWNRVIHQLWAIEEALERGQGV